MTSYRDWVVETSSTTGTGTYSLSGSPPAGTSYFTFRQRFSNGETKVVYWVVNADRTKWEKNRFGTLTYGSPDTLSRNVVESTNGDAPVSWVGGDGPLRLYVVPDADAEEFAISMGLGTSRPDVLKFGIWADEDALDTGVHQLKLYDGAAESAVGSVNVVGGATQAILFGLPPGFIKRTLARNSGTPTTKLDVTFTCMDSTDAVGLKQTSALTKRTGGSWAAGNDANGMGQGLTIANTTWYHVFAILVDGVVDCYFDTSASAANKPANTTHFRRLGSIKTDGSAQIVDFTQDGDRFTWAVPVADVNTTNLGASAVTTTLASVPTGIVVQAWFSNRETNTTTNRQVLWTALDQVDTTPSATLCDINCTTTGSIAAAFAGEFYRKTNTSGQIRYRATASGASDGTNVTTKGWIDDCGRNG